MNSSLRSVNEFIAPRIARVGFESEETLLKVFLSRVSMIDESGRVLQKSLSHLDFSRSNLFGLDLRDADFSHCLMHNAELSGAQLMRASFSGADLTGARFERANLDFANFGAAKFDRTDLSDARMFELSDIFGSSEGVIIVSWRTLMWSRNIDNVPLDRLDVGEGEVEKRKRIRGADIVEHAKIVSKMVREIP